MLNRQYVQILHFVQTMFKTQNEISKNEMKQNKYFMHDGHHHYYNQNLFTAKFGKFIVLGYAVVL